MLALRRCQQACAWTWSGTHMLVVEILRSLKLYGGCAGNFQNFRLDGGCVLAPCTGPRATNSVSRWVARFRRDENSLYRVNTYPGTDYSGYNNNSVAWSSVLLHHAFSMHRCRKCVNNTAVICYSKLVWTPTLISPRA